MGSRGYCWMLAFLFAASPLLAGQDGQRQKKAPPDPKAIKIVEGEFRAMGVFKELITLRVTVTVAVPYVTVLPSGSVQRRPVGRGTLYSQEYEIRSGVADVERYKRYDIYLPRDVEVRLMSLEPILAAAKKPEAGAKETPFTPGTIADLKRGQQVEVHYTESVDGFHTKVARVIVIWKVAK